MKKVLSLILSVIIIASMLGAVPISVNADEKPGYIVLTDGSALSGDWKVNGNCISWITMKYESDGEDDYVLFDSNPERTRIYAGVYNHALMFHNAPVTVDLNEYPIFEFVYKMTNADTIAEGVNSVLQVSLVSGEFEDGRLNNNMAFPISGEWFRWGTNPFYVNAPGNAGDHHNVDVTKINGFKIAHMNYSGVAYEADIAVSNVVFFTPETYQARADAEAKVTAMVAKLNANSPVKDIIDAAQAYADGVTKYYNFMIEDYEKLNTLGEFAIAQGRINAIGEVTVDKKEAIESARAAYDALTDEQMDMVENYDVLLAAESRYVEVMIDSIGEVAVYKHTLINHVRDLYEQLADSQKKTVDNYEAFVLVEKELEDIRSSRAVKSMIEKLPEPADITIENKYLVKNAREAYDALSEEAKLMIASVERLEAAEAVIGSSFVRGELDGKEGVTASDALMALQAAVKKTSLDADVEQAADVDGQEGLTASDALCILQYAVGKLSVFPADVAQ